MRSDQVQSAVDGEGIGDVVAYGVVVTPERGTGVVFSTPFITDVKQVIVTGCARFSLNFWGPRRKEVYVTRTTTYNLTANETLKKAGKTPIIIKLPTRI